MKIRFAALVAMPALLLASTKHATSKTPAKSASKTASTKTVSKKRTTHKKGRYVSKRKPVGPSYQTHPTPERYKEIQQALADKGYFKGDVDGKWGDDSSDALKRFQSEHQLENDGKINSLSLIQLGLGPKHDGSAVTTVSPELPPPPPPVTEASPQEQTSAQ